jgi:hypothetical protein
MATLLLLVLQVTGSMVLRVLLCNTRLFVHQDPWGQFWECNENLLLLWEKKFLLWESYLKCSGWWVSTCLFKSDVSLVSKRKISFLVSLSFLSHYKFSCGHLLLLTDAIQRTKDSAPSHSMKHNRWSGGVLYMFRSHQTAFRDLYTWKSMHWVVSMDDFKPPCDITTWRTNSVCS